MVYRQDNRRNKHKGRYTILGIVLGISLALAAVYLYDNNKQPILDNVNQVKNFAIKQIPKDSPIIQATQDSKSVPVQNNPVEQITPTSLGLQIYNLVNKQRESNGLPDLQLDSTLSEIALQHSNDMMQHNYFDHNDLNGNDPSYRLNCQNPRENIAWTDGYSLDKSAGIIIDDWMGSPEHRDNILNTNSISEGIGIAINGNHVIVTEDFC